jgi:hypothetical protein
MINTKYFILNPSSQALRNPHAMGHGWLVKDIRMVDTPDQEYLALGDTDLDSVAIVERSFEDLLPANLSHEEVSGSVVLTDYRPNLMTYEVQADQPSLAVFSEIYYEGGWKARIDGEPVPHIRANYILRALPVDAGTHTVEFEFVFKPFEIGEKVSMVGSWLVLLLLLGGAVFYYYSRKAGIRKEDQ